MLKEHIDTIVLHCAATSINQNFSVEDIDLMHRRRGWRKIGYHFYITKDGEVHKGRELTEQGAHVGGQNKNKIGICYEGGLDSEGKPEDTRTEAQKEAIEHTICNILDECPNVKDICGHRDLSPDKDGDGVVEKHEWLKACPCYNAREEHIHLL